MNRVDQAIAVIQFTLKKRQQLIDKYNRQSDLTESQRQFILEEVDLKQNIQILIEEVKTDYKKTLGKLPPQDIELEKNVLGTIIFENPAFDKAKLFLRPEHFYLKEHELIWSAALEYGKTQPVDSIGIINVLRKRSQAEEIGGLHYLATLTARAGSVYNIETWGRILIEKSIKRELLVAAGEIFDESYRDESDCFEILEKTKEQIKRVESWIK
jgi:replicative DNA helicase